MSLAGAGLAAEPAGPPRPIAPKLTLAEQAIAHVRASAETAKPCIRRAGEITVCAADEGRSRYRIPLPDERPPQPHAGEFAKVDIGTGPVPVVPGTTVAGFGMGRTAKARNATLKLIYAQEEAKAKADAERAPKAADVQPADPPPAEP